MKLTMEVERCVHVPVADIIAMVQEKYGVRVPAKFALCVDAYDHGSAQTVALKWKDEEQVK